MDIQAQGTNSLTTSYFGDFLTDIDTNNLLINFIGTGNDFCAADTGRWAPLPDGSSGTATAIYGLQADVSGLFQVALRDFHMKADTFGQGLYLYPNDDGSLGYASAQTISINAGTGTWAHPTLGHGPVNLGGVNGPNQANDGNLNDNGNGTLTLIVPVSVSYNTTIGGQPATVNFDGQIVGIGTNPWTRPQPPRHQGRLGEGIGSLLADVKGNPIAGSPGHGLTPGSEQGISLVPTEVPVQGQTPRSGDPVSPPSHHSHPAASDPFAVQDAVFQGMP
jgi:hypothetical protein